MENIEFYTKVAETLMKELDNYNIKYVYHPCNPHSDDYFKLYNAFDIYLLEREVCNILLYRNDICIRDIYRKDTPEEDSYYDHIWDREYAIGHVLYNLVSNSTNNNQLARLPFSILLKIWHMINLGNHEDQPSPVDLEN